MCLFFHFYQNFDVVGDTGKGTKISQPAKISQVAKFRKPGFSQAVAKIRKVCMEGSPI